MGGEGVGVGVGVSEGGRVFVGVVVGVVVVCGRTEKVAVAGQACACAAQHGEQEQHASQQHTCRCCQYPCAGE